MSRSPLSFNGHGSTSYDDNDPGTAPEHESREVRYTAFPGLYCLDYGLCYLLFSSFEVKLSRSDA